MPLRGTSIIHPRFQQHMAPTIAATFRSSGRLMRLGNPQGIRDPEVGRTTFPTPWPVYEGPVRLQSRGDGSAQGRTAPVGDRLVTLGAYLLALPATSEPARLGDIFEVLECPDMPGLIDAKLKVVDAPQADTAVQRSYGADLHQPTIRG